jgi:8-oxo-dGTP pyrophosphatase MutT (NUDIX family)
MESCLLSHVIRPSYCTNCGQSGHIFRNCLSPVTSYGMIAVKYTDDHIQQSMYSSQSSIVPSCQSLQFLLIRRKDSLSFIEFIRGKYGHSDEEYIGKLLRNMTQHEQEMLLQRSFSELWYQIWGELSTMKSHKNNYEISEKRFLQLKDELPRLIKQNPSPWKEPEWGFPKGRRNPHESDLHCAIREFQEETGIKRHEFQVIQNTHSISETFFGSNHVHYCHKYYLAICSPGLNVHIQSNNPLMFREIGDIQWCSLEEAISMIRPDNVEKREILLKAGKILKNFYPVYSFDSPKITQ